MYCIHVEHRLGYTAKYCGERSIVHVTSGRRCPRTRGNVFRVALESDDVIAAALDNAIKTSASAKVAILHLMGRCKVIWQDLKRHIEGELLLHAIHRLDKSSVHQGLDISFSRVTWDQVTRLVEITPAYGLARVPVF